MVAIALGKSSGIGSHAGCRSKAHTLTCASEEASCTTCERDSAKVSISVCTHPSLHVIESVGGVVDSGR